MTKEELLIKIEREEPQIIYFSGKTSTGKSTFVKNLNSNSKFTVIELDKIVEKEIISKFNLNHNDAFLDVYGNEKSDYLEIFSSAVQSEIRSKLRFSAVIVEGAIAKSGILQKIFSGNLENFLFVYFHPINLESYIQRIHARLVEGIISGNSRLPKPFWERVSESDLQEYKSTGNINRGISQAIEAYASSSKKKSEERLKNFQENYPNIVVIEV
jgi:guanylate kinase